MVDDESASDIQMVRTGYITCRTCAKWKSGIPCSVLLKFQDSNSRTLKQVQGHFEHRIVCDTPMKLFSTQEVALFLALTLRLLYHWPHTLNLTAQDNLSKSLIWDPDNTYDLCTIGKWTKFENIRWFKWSTIALSFTS